MNKYPPECHFCGRVVDRPESIKTEFGEVLGGRCRCGAVYVCDPTGHNTGEAYMEALALAKGDWQIGSIDQDVDYQAEDVDYDLKTHQRIYTKGFSSMSGKLVFVKLAVPGTESAPAPVAAPVSAGEAPEEKGGGRKLKKRVRALLETASFDEVAALALQDKGVIRWLISSAYDKEDVVSWRAIEAVGLVSRVYAAGSVEVIRDTVRRLLWSMGEESGGIGWSAAEMLGEIIANNPDEFGDIAPIVWSFRDEEMFRAGVVWAMGRIAAVRPDLVPFTAEALPQFLEDKNPVVRGYAAWTAGILAEETAGIEKLLSDNSEILFYDQHCLQRRTVADIAREALHKRV
ncbi:MAG: DVU0298 family protein [Nitrospirota bacterium]